jgi:hypothetical protein
MHHVIHFRSNNQSIIDPFDAALEKAHAMFSSGAYIHHYMKYGLEADAFEHSFDVIQQAISSYKSVS